MNLNVWNVKSDFVAKKVTWKRHDVIIFWNNNIHFICRNLCQTFFFQFLSTSFLTLSFNHAYEMSILHLCHSRITFLPLLSASEGVLTQPWTTVKEWLHKLSISLHLSPSSSHSYPGLLAESQKSQPSFTISCEQKIGRAAKLMQILWSYVVHYLVSSLSYNLLPKNYNFT